MPAIVCKIDVLEWSISYYITTLAYSLIQIPV